MSNLFWLALTLPPRFVQPQRDSGVQFCQGGRFEPRGWRGAGHGAQRQTALRGEAGGVFVWGLPANIRMRAVNIAVGAPVGQRGAGVGQRREQGLVQQFVRCPAGAARIAERGASFH